jgi:hypothetical protein
MAEEEKPSGWQRAKGVAKAGAGVTGVGFFVATFPVGWAASAAVGVTANVAGFIFGSKTLHKIGATMIGGPISCGLLAAEGTTNAVTGKPTGKWGPTSWVGSDYKKSRSTIQMGTGLWKTLGGAVGVLFTANPVGWGLSTAVGAALVIGGAIAKNPKTRRMGVALIGGPITCGLMAIEGANNLITGTATTTWGPTTWIQQGGKYSNNPKDVAARANSQNSPATQQNVNYKQEVQKAQTLEQATTLYNQGMKKEHEFKVASETVNANGDRVIVYQDPRDNNPDKNVTYVMGQNGELKEIMPGKAANCTLPPTGTDKGGFATLEVKAGVLEINARDGGAIKVTIKPPTAPRLSPLPTPPVAGKQTGHSK